MEHEPILSLVIPVYNVQDYLAEALDSVVNQAISDELEVLIINDGASDNSLEIAEYYAQRNEYVKVISIENSGLGAARNVGAMHARGRYVQFMDSDDILAAGILTNVVDEIRNNGDADVFVFDYAEFTDNVMNNASRYQFDLNRFQYGNVAWNKVYRLDFWRDNKFQYPEGIKYEDTPLTHIIMALSNRSVKIPAIGYYYRRSRQGSITAETSIAYDFHNRLYALEILRGNIIKYHRNIQEKGMLNKIKIKYLKEILLLFWSNKNHAGNLAKDDLVRLKRMVFSDSIDLKLVLDAGFLTVLLYLIEKILLWRVK
ncbi:glycosyltransferase family 2 protein [Weissella hellenica]|uniref:glycosyltransferase family 2 protein n=1 Tax=Weissella hellenica TaxID=46256 RepID=UPI0038888348